MPSVFCNNSIHDMLAIQILFSMIIWDIDSSQWMSEFEREKTTCPCQSGPGRAIAGHLNLKLWAGGWWCRPAGGGGSPHPYITVARQYWSRHILTAFSWPAIHNVMWCLSVGISSSYVPSSYRYFNQNMTIWQIWPSTQQLARKSFKYLSWEEL